MNTNSPLTQSYALAYTPNSLLHSVPRIVARVSASAHVIKSVLTRAMHGAKYGATPAQAVFLKIIP